MLGHRLLLGSACLAWVLGSALAGVEMAAAAPPLRFDAPRCWETCRLPSQVLALDLDGDGDRDLAVRCPRLTDEPQLQLFETVADGTLSLQATLALEGSGDLVAGDLDGDGRVDLCQVDPVGEATATLAVYLRQGAFSFSAATRELDFSAARLFVADVDGTGGLDLVLPDDLTRTSVHLLLGAGDGTFGAAASYPTDQWVFDADGNGEADVQCDFQRAEVAVGDLDGDGLDDVVYAQQLDRVLNPQSSRGIDTGAALQECPTSPDASAFTLTLLRGRGDGSLGAPQTVADTPMLSMLRTADLDGDGDRDVVAVGPSIAGPDRQDVIVLRNRGDASFLPATRYASGGLLPDIGSVLDVVGRPEVADVDGDGDLDVALVLYGPQNGHGGDPLVDYWALLRNDGAGHLAPPERRPSGADLLDLTFAQLDGESGLEAVSAASGDDRVVVHYHQDGGYRALPLVSIDDPRHPSVGTPPLELVAGDFDGDGRADLAAVTEVSSLSAPGPDTLVLLSRPAQGLPAVAEVVDLPEGAVRAIAEPLAGDAAADLALLFTVPSFSTAPEGVGLTLGAVGSWPVAPAVTATAGSPVDLAAFDVDGDGQPELALLRHWQAESAELSARIAVYDVAADGALSLLGALALGSDDVLADDSRLPEALASADLDGDGRRDLIVVTRGALGPPERVLSVWLNNGDLSVTPLAERYTAPREVTDLVGADVTGDGRTDLVLVTRAGDPDPSAAGTVEVHVNQGGGVLGPGVSIPVGVAPVRVVAAHLDGAPGVDLAVANDGSNEVTVLLNDGAGGYPVVERYAAGGDSNGLAVADLDGDGDLDLALAHDEHYRTENGEGHVGRVGFLLHRAVDAAPRCDLTVQVAAAPQPAAVAQPLTFTVTAANAGPDPAEGLSLQLQWPAAATLDAVTPDRGGCSSSAGRVDCDLGTLAAASSAGVQLVLIAAAVGELTVGAVASSATQEVDASDNWGTGTTTVSAAVPPPTCNLSLELTAGPDMATLGEAFSHTLRVANAGPDPAEGVSLQVDLPVEVVLVEVTASQGSCLQDPSRVDCALGTMAAGTEVTVRLEASSPVAATLTWTAATDSATADADAANNGLTHAVVVSEAPPPPTCNLSLALSDGPDTVRVGEAQVYTVTVTNAGPDGAEEVTLRGGMPPGAVCSEVSVSQGSCVRAGEEVVCSLGVLEAGASASLQLQVAAGAAGTLTVTGEVSSATDEADPADNQSERTVTVEEAPDDPPDTGTAGGGGGGGGGGGCFLHGVSADW